MFENKSDRFCIEQAQWEQRQEIVDLIRMVGREMQNKNIFSYTEESDQYDDFIANYPCLVAKMEEQIVGVFLCYGGNDDELEVYEAAEVPPEETIIFDTCVVHPDYRGYHLEKRMGEVLMGQIKNQFRYAICTVSPDNPASYRSMESLGFEILREVYVYGGKRRYIMKCHLYCE